VPGIPDEATQDEESPIHSGNYSNQIYDYKISNCMRKIRILGFFDYSSFLRLKSVCYNLDFNNATIYFALITKLDIFNGSFDNCFIRFYFYFFYD